MALPPAYLAAEEPAARRSRALHRFTVASPLVLLLAVGAVGHVRRAPLVQPAGMAEYDRHVLAYRPRVVAVRALASQNRPSLEETRREGERWVVGYRSGELVPLTPAFFEDHLQSGARGEALRGGTVLSSLLSILAERDIANCRPTEGARTALLSAQVARGLRDFEAQSLFQSLLAQRRATYVLGQAWNRLPAKDRAAAAPTLRTLFVSLSDVERLVAADRRQYEEYRRRQKIADESASPFSGATAQWEDHALDRSVRISNGHLTALLKTASIP